MSRTYEFYREQENNDDADTQEYLERERQYYMEQMELLKDTDDISEVPSTEEDLFRQILEDERNEN